MANLDLLIILVLGHFAGLGVPPPRWRVGCLVCQRRLRPFVFVSALLFVLCCCIFPCFVLLFVSRKMKMGGGFLGSGLAHSFV